MRKLPFYGLLVLVIVTIVGGGRPAAASYTFTMIADSNGIFSTQFGTASINNGGTVAFFAALDSGMQGIFKGRGGDTITVVDETFGFDSFGSNPAINNSGNVVFPARTPGHTNHDIYTGDGSPVRLIVQADSGQFTALGNGSINDAGVVGFFANLATGGSGVFSSDGTTTTTIFQDTNISTGVASINNKGDVTFRSASSGLLKGNGQSLVTINVSGGNAAINNPGLVVFQGGVIDPILGQGEGIFVGDGGPVMNVVDSFGPYRGFEFPAINDSGNVAFGALLDSGPEGIFVGSDPVRDKVILVGDELFGSTVTDLQFYSAGLNNRGQVAFRASLADGTLGVYRADPSNIAEVPEPSSLAIGLIAFVGMVCRRKGSV